MGILILFLIGIVAIGLIVLIIAVYFFNRFIVLKNRVKNSWAQIDVQLKKRADMIMNLVNIVKGYAKHEKSTFEKIAKIRNSIIDSNGEDVVKKSNELAKASKSLFAVVENYPELKANKNFLELQRQLVKLEGDIAKARMVYNDIVTKYNIEIQEFPNNLFASLFGFGKKEYYKIGKLDRIPVEVRL